MLGKTARISSIRHPLHADALRLIEEGKAFITNLLELSLEDDGTPASAARSIELKFRRRLISRRTERLANAQLGKAKKS